ncbi:YolD-like family protein [Heyndrickxia sporothermodurans]
MMSIKDRGMKKWHGFMMPEHVEVLNEMWIENQKIKMPVWDEKQIAELEQLIRLLKSIIYM